MESVDRELQTSKCTARVAKQVNRQPYFLIRFRLEDLPVTKPNQNKLRSKKSTPTKAKGLSPKFSVKLMDPLIAVPI